MSARWLGRALVASMALTLVACATPTPPLYYWGDYQRQVYTGLKQEGSPEEQLQALQVQMQKAQGQGAALPPGFRAHIGWLYLQMRQPDLARQQFEAEKAAFPESTVYMDFLLKRLNSAR